MFFRPSLCPKNLIKENKMKKNKKRARISEQVLRFVSLGVIFVINFILFVMLVSYGAQYVWIYALLEVLSIVVTLVLLARNDNPTYKIAWVVVIMAFPIFGICIYILFGMDTLKNADMLRLSRLEHKNAPRFEEKVYDAMRSQENSGDALSQARFLGNVAHARAFERTETKYYPLGDLLFPDLLEDLKSAEKFIFLEYFIIEEGIMWNSILEILKEKVKNGVDVRVIYDDMGSMFTLKHRYPKVLRSYGIKCIAFRRVVPILSSSFNNRDHRKICVVDGKVAYTGGINLADEYINKKERFGHWLDCGIRLRGEAVSSFTSMFLSMWEYVTLKKQDISKFAAPEGFLDTVKSDGFLVPYSDSPCDEYQVGEDAYLNMISQAKKYVYICTPYLAIGHQMISALTRAARSGVDVRIMTPGIPDKPPVHSLSRSYYEPLVSAGVKIYEYQPGFLHSKTFVCDDCLAICGTINLDFRSFCLHHECAVWMYSSSAVLDIKESFLSNLDKCTEITRTWCKKTPLIKKGFRLFLRLFSPLL